ncbi:putative G-protein coupled receptor 153 isoform X1 [Lampetra fluviatilis]
MPPLSKWRDLSHAPTMSADEPRAPYNQSLSWLICALVAFFANVWGILSVTAKQHKWKPLDMLICALGATHALNAGVPIAMYSVIQMRKYSSDFEWNEGVCKVFVSTFYTLTLATSFTVTSLSYHRMWMVRWPVNYRLSNARKQALQTVAGVWTVSFVLCALPAVGWHDTAERFYHRDCRFIVGKIGLGFAVCFLLLVAGSSAMSVACIGVAFFQTVRAGCGRGHAAAGASDAAFTVPAIVVEDAQGKRRSSIDGSESVRTSLQITYLVTAVVVLYDALAAMPIMAVSFVSIRHDAARPWMVIACLWCSLVQTMLFPAMVWLCERYRADCRAIWDKCLALLASDEEKSAGCPYASPYGSAQRFDPLAPPETLSVERFTHGGGGGGGADGCGTAGEPGEPGGSELHLGLDSFPLCELPQGDRMQYLQVPQTRRFSHDEGDVWQGAQTAYLQVWAPTGGSGVIHIHGAVKPGDLGPGGGYLLAPYSDPQLAGHPAYHHHHHRRRRLSDDYGALMRQRLPCGGGGGNDVGQAGDETAPVARAPESSRYVSREDVARFIDKTSVTLGGGGGGSGAAATEPADSAELRTIVLADLAEEPRCRHPAPLSPHPNPSPDPAAPSADAGGGGGGGGDDGAAERTRVSGVDGSAGGTPARDGDARGLAVPVVSVSPAKEAAAKPCGRAAGATRDGSDGAAAVAACARSACERGAPGEAGAAAASESAAS